MQQNDEDEDWNRPALTEREMQQKAKARKRSIRLGLFALGMLILAFANVPLFKMFCTHMGFITPDNERLAAAVIPVDHSRQFQLNFSAVSALGLKIQIAPADPLQEAYIGEKMRNIFRFTNPTGKTVEFRVHHAVMPPPAATHMALIKCFCFSNHVLQPHQSITLPMVYQLNPGIDRSVHRISVSYTLYPEK